MRELILLLGTMSFATLAYEALAQSADQLEIVETRSQVEIVLIDADFLRPEDPSFSIIGGTAQFLDGETILAELEMIQPVSSDELEAMKEAGNGEAGFICEEVVLYLANETHVVAAKGCTAHAVGQTP